MFSPLVTYKQLHSAAHLLRLLHLPGDTTFSLFIIAKFLPKLDFDIDKRNDFSECCSFDSTSAISHSLLNALILLLVIIGSD